MHLAEGILPLEQAMGWTAVGTVALAWSVRGEQKARKANPASSTLMAGVTSLLFAVTLLPLPVPVVGATSHICLTPVLALIVGTRRIVWPTCLILLLQAVFFAHGGLTTLGLNTMTLGFIGPIGTVALWELLRRMGMGNAWGLAIACAAGDLVVYVADAIVLAMALEGAVDPMTTFTGVVIGFSPVQVPLAVLEAAASVGIVRLLAARRPDLLPQGLRALRKTNATATTAALVLFVVNLSGCSYEGIDGTIFGAAAESGGRAPTDSILDLSQGELGLAMTIIILFGLGFIAGRTWERELNRKGDENAR